MLLRRNTWRSIERALPVYLAMMLLQCGRSAHKVELALADASVANQPIETQARKAHEPVVAEHDAGSENAPLQPDAGDPRSELSANDVKATAARFTPSVKRACWQSALDTRAPGTAPTARVKVTITIAPTGRVLQAITSEEPKGYRGLTFCVGRRVQGWQFPPSGGTTTTNVPFVFGAE